MFMVEVEAVMMWERMRLSTEQPRSRPHLSLGWQTILRTRERVRE